MVVGGQCWGQAGRHGETASLEVRQERPSFHSGVAWQRLLVFCAHAYFDYVTAQEGRGMRAQRRDGRRDVVAASWKTIHVVLGQHGDWKRRKRNPGLVIRCGRRSTFQMTCGWTKQLSTGDTGCTALGAASPPWYVPGMQACKPPPGTDRFDPREHQALGAGAKITAPGASPEQMRRRAQPTARPWGPHHARYAAVWNVRGYISRHDFEDFRWQLSGATGHVGRCGLASYTKRTNSIVLARSNKTRAICE